MTVLASLFLHALETAAYPGGVWVIWKLLTDPWGER